MTRVIKFRAWDISIPTYAESMENKKASGQMVGWDYVKQSSYLLDGINGKYPIMQFTGLLDKHGKEIYEGDIFKQEVLMVQDGGNRHNDGTYWITCVHVVVFNTDKSRFCGKYEFTRLNKKSSSIDYSRFTNRSGFVDLDRNIEVIGNIYQNEELIK